MVEKRNRVGTVYFEDQTGEIKAKMCTECGEIKCMEDFASAKRCLGGRNSVCRSCRKRQNTRVKSCVICGSPYNTTNINSKYCSDLCRGRKVAKYSIDEVKKIFKDKNYILTDSEYTDAHTPLRFICNKGHNTTISLVSLKRGSQCRKCVRERIASQQRHAFEFVKSEFEKRGYKLLSTNYQNSDQKLDVECDKGHQFKMSYGVFQRGSGCTKCSWELSAERQKHELSHVVKIFSIEGCTLLSEEYKNNRSLLDFICSCGNKDKVSLQCFNRGQRCSFCNKKKMIGENHPFYNPKLTDEERYKNRDYSEYINWRKSVYERDSYTCVTCNNRGGDLNAHHLDGYGWCEERRTDVSNGVTLCNDCHTDFHVKYGYGNNTEKQFNDWFSIRNQDAYIASFYFA